MGTPNMNLILPTDHGSADQWDAILDAVFTRIDGHDHSTGNGATIAMSSLKVDADISWAFGGSQRAITDLKAIDFSPQASSAVASLAGALFLNSADNELYYRTTTGANVKITNGAALNFAAFVGGIGGDYGAVGALEIFDDATDAYWFQQQVASAVRQYAKLRAADLSLYEYKAAGATPVPSFAVTLRSPTALAAPYTLTLPGALPASTKPFRTDAAGNVTFSYTDQIVFNVALALVGVGGSNSTLTTTGAFTVILQLGSNAGATDVLPVYVPAGATVTGWNVWLKKFTTAGTVSCLLHETDMTSETTSQIGATQSNSANNPGFIQLGQTGLNTLITAGNTLYIEARSAGQTGGVDRIYGYSVTIA
jgi:hypothetical protein